MMVSTTGGIIGFMCSNVFCTVVIINVHDLKTTNQQYPMTVCMVKL